MTNSLRLFLTFLSTYLFIHIGYWALKFHPVHEDRPILGRLVDFSVWIVVFFLADWVIRKMFAPKMQVQ